MNDKKNGRTLVSMIQLLCVMGSLLSITVMSAACAGGSSRSTELTAAPAQLASIVQSDDEREESDPPIDEDDGDEVPTETISLPNRESGETEEFKLELAPDPDSVARGLMGREEIAEHGGMLFIYPKPERQSFWMKNCLIDIDIIFVDARGVVTATHEMKAAPLRKAGEQTWRYESRLRRYLSRRPAQFAIELKAGSVKRLDIRRGQHIDAEWERIGKLARGWGRDGG